MILSQMILSKPALSPTLHNSVGVEDSFGRLSQGSPALRDNPGLGYAIPLGLDAGAELLPAVNDSASISQADETQTSVVFWQNHFWQNHEDSNDEFFTSESSKMILLS